MPMLKTAPSGTTSITNVQSYLMRAQRQGHEQHSREWEQYEAGQIQLSERQAGLLQAYLGERTRGLAVDVSEDLSVRNWARQMDITRALYDHDRPAKQGKSRSYYHFILSPRMEDNCDLPTLRAYANAWARENFRTGLKEHEYAIVYHDDNEQGILHAHIVVNVTNKATGKKLHLNNDEVVGLEISAQEIGKRFGLTPLREQMQQTIGARTRQPIYLDRAEREILNKGGYSWKWELRKVIMDIAPLANGFEDFKRMLNRAGFDVFRSEKTGYLTYTHRNGLKVKDARLGARFYLESLEKVFNHERLLEDRSYSSWELIKISKGEVPWKEDIRRAIDAVSPTVMSVPELGQELGRRFGIRLIVNRRGITYQHPQGFKTRDVGIGLCYTFEGLQQNAVVGMTLPYPGYNAILQGSSLLSQRYMPKGKDAGDLASPEEAASRFVYRDLTRLMVRNGLVRIDDVAPMLEKRHKDLRQEKAEVVGLRNQVMRWNHLAALQTRFERDRDFLANEGEGAEPGFFNDVLIRYERIGRYLEEQAAGVNIRGAQKASSGAYEKRLGEYQAHLNDFNRDQSVYRNYLIARNVRMVDGSNGGALSVDAKALIEASKTLSTYRIRDFFHLEQVITNQEERLAGMKGRLEQLEGKRRELEFIQDDIRAYLETKTVLPESDVLAERPLSLGIQSQMLRFQDASGRLSALGISEADFAGQDNLYRRVKAEHSALSAEFSQVMRVTSSLKRAQEACLAVADTMKVSGGQEIASVERIAKPKEADSSLSARDARDSKSEEKVTNVFEDLPFEEAKRRRKERMKNAPERSIRMRDERER